MRMFSLLKLLKKNHGCKAHTYEKALAVCSHFQNIIGKKYDNRHGFATAIERLAVCPHDEHEKDAYMRNNRIADGEALLQAGKANRFYCVVVVAYRLPEKTQMLYKDIEVCLHENDIPFNPDEL